MDTEPEPPVPTITVVVRLHRVATGRIRGFVERPRTGAKEAFDGLPAVADAISKLLGGAAEGHHDHVRPAGDREAPDPPAATEGRPDVTS